jgi:hypothetical protein
METQRMLASHLLAKIVACVFIASAMTGTALACQKDPAAPAVVNLHSTRILMATVTVSASPIRTVAKAERNGQGRCSTNCHCQTIGCGCCFANAASLNPVSASLFLASASIQLSPLDQSEAASARPPPDFRPPRIFI